MAKRLMSFGAFMDKLVYKGVEGTEDSPSIEDYEVVDGYFEEGELKFKGEDGQLHDVIHIQQEGGGEGGTEYCETILKVGDVFMRITYSYYSHLGYEFDGAEVHEVTPTQKTITVYE